MIKYDTLLGKPFELGTNDCYSLIRDFYKINYSIDLPNYARPNQFWIKGMDLYMERYHKNGFRSLNVHPVEYRPGDVVLMAIRSDVANHAGVLVENGRILHHFNNRFSCVEQYKGIWRNTTVAVLRHKDSVDLIDTEVVDLMSVLSPSRKRRIEQAIQDRETATQAVSAG